jgi:iduronate 2-sulfatase
MFAVFAPLLLAASTHTQKQNVLYIVIDDLRTELGCYENSSFSPSPHIDSFAKTATVFEHAYCSQAVCSPSRNSFLSGRVPDTTEIWNFKGSFRDRDGGSWVSLPQWFKEKGWTTAGGGKVFHPNSPPKNDPPSWSLKYFSPAIDSCKKANSHNYSCIADEAGTVDYKIVSNALDVMTNLSSANSTPWFVAVGLHRPHIDWSAPQWAFDKHPLNASWLAPISGPLSVAPAGMAPEAFYSWNNADRFVCALLALARISSSLPSPPY